MRNKPAAAVQEQAIAEQPAKVRKSRSEAERRAIDIRRDNARVAVKKFGVTRASAALGYQNAAYLSSMIGPNPSRDISDSMARRIETICNLPRLSLDQDPTVAVIAAPAPDVPVLPTELIAAVIRAVGQACTEENLDPGFAKLADLAKLAYEDSVSHGGTPRPDFVKMLVKLAK